MQGTIRKTFVHFAHSQLLFESERGGSSRQMGGGRSSRDVVMPFVAVQITADTEQACAKRTRIYTVVFKAQSKYITLIPDKIS
jgi:hypothetical protein